MVVRCTGAGAGAEVLMAGRAVAPEEGRAAGRDDMLGARPPTRPPERPASAASMGEKVSARARKTDIAGFFQSVAAIVTDGEAMAVGLATMGVIGTKAMGESIKIAAICELVDEWGDTWWKVERVAVCVWCLRARGFFFSSRLLFLFFFFL